MRNIPHPDQSRRRVCGTFLTPTNRIVILPPRCESRCASRSTRAEWEWDLSRAPSETAGKVTSPPSR
eukprot:88746-Prorocentrum_minimum.AAC.2